MPIRHRAALKFLLIATLLLVTTGLLGACETTPADPGSPVDPAKSGFSLSGYDQHTLDLTASGIQAKDVQSVRVGGIRAFDVKPHPDQTQKTAVQSQLLRFTLQGQPLPGLAAIVIHTAAGDHTLPQTVRYLPPLDPRFARFAAIGASLTQGVQAGVPSHRGSLYSPPAQLARQIRAFCGLPLPVHEFLPGITPADIGPPPTCGGPSVAGVVTSQFAKVIPKFKDPITGELTYAAARIDADIEVRNLGVGGAKVHDMVHGPQQDNVGINFTSNLVYAPYTGFLQPVQSTQLHHLEALKPTLIISTDLMANDIVQAVLGADDIDPKLVTPHAQLAADLQEMVTRLAATGAEVYLATMPLPTALPAVKEKRALMLASGSTAAEVDARLAQIDKATLAANQTLRDIVKPWPKVHIVDLAAAVDQVVKAGGLQVGTTQLTTRKLGGLLGLDGVHFSNTGYGFVANLFVDAINATLKTKVPRIDLVEVLRTDPESPEALGKAGLKPGLCD